MTGHANKDDNVGDGKPLNQAELIINYCRENKFYCLYSDWQSSHNLGTDYFENRLSHGGSVTYGAHNSQHITANRKAYAMWYILATIAGWDGE